MKAQTISALLLACATSINCTTEIDEESDSDFRAATQLSVSIPRPTASTPIDVMLKANAVFTFNGQYFYARKPGTPLKAPTQQTVVQAVRSGDVVAVNQGGLVKRFTVVALDDAGLLVAIAQNDDGPSVQASFPDVPESWIPDPGEILECVVQATFAGQQCIAQSGDVACCMAFEAQAVAMCYANIWGHSIPEGQGSVWADLCGGGGDGGGGGGGGDGADAGGNEGGGVDCGDDEQVEDVPVDVNGKTCHFTGWVTSFENTDGECVTVIDQERGFLDCGTDIPGGNLPPPGEVEDN